LLKARQKLGKYRIVRRLAEGGFATIYEATDTIEGVRVALRVPRARFVDKHMLETFRKEVRLVARLEHPHILPIKNAEFIGDQFVVTTLLGTGTLRDQIYKRTTTQTVLSFAEQILQAVGHAHEHSIIHCDIKPDNLILFPGHHLRLTDFGIAKVSQATLSASGSGTVGYLAPEQALGRPSFRSDVFSIGLVLWRMLSGSLPVWPFAWPPDGIERVKRKVHPDLIALIERSLQVDQYRRFPDATHMLAAFRKLKKGRRLFARQRRKSRSGAGNGTDDWKTAREKLFLRRFRRVLELKHRCGRCGGPMSESMRCCPLCGSSTKVFRGETSLPARCPRCGRGRKLDWRFCAHCHGPGFRRVEARRYSDKRYVARCSNPRCSRKELMPFLRYCPWCRTKVKRQWPIAESGGRCKGCGWGVVQGLWDWCPWCARKLARG